MQEKRINVIGFWILLVLVLVSFFVIFAWIYPVRFSNLGGYNSWLSGSTLKFVNQWLAEGAWNDRFICFESFASIEFADKAARSPYLSYPPGSSAAVYAAAQLMGKSHIGISFLKHFQMVWYLAEALLLAAFLYLVMADLHIFTERIRVAAAYFLTCFWVLLPVNVWYLANVYFADQAVIFYVLLFLFLAYIRCRKLTVFQKNVVNGIQSVVIYFGFLTDYYFWILVFLVFLFACIRNRMCRQGIRRLLRDGAWYVFPAVLAVGTFVWQLSHFENDLLEKFLYRAGGDIGADLGQIIFLNFCWTLADDSKVKGIVLIILELLIFLGFLVYRKINGVWKTIMIKEEVSLLTAAAAAPVMQILLLRNHSAVHEFSMIKIGWLLTLSILGAVFLLSALILRLKPVFNVKKTKIHACSFAAALLFFLYLIGFPLRIREFLDSRSEEVFYPLEWILYEKAEYKEVYFSFTYEIPVNPPQKLAVSQKQVHKIETLEEIGRRFPELPADAQIMLVIEKNAEKKESSVIEMESMLAQKNKCVYEDDVYCILHLTHGEA